MKEGRKGFPGKGCSEREFRMLEEKKSLSHNIPHVVMKMELNEKCNVNVGNKR